MGVSDYRLYLRDAFYRSLCVLNMPDYRSWLCEILRIYRSFEVIWGGE